MIALIYVLDDLGQSVAGRLRLQDGRIIGDPPDDPSVEFVLGREIDRYQDGTVTRLNAEDHPQDFLLALPGAYTGTMIRVGLESEGDGKNPVSRGSRSPRSA